MTNIGSGPGRSRQTRVYVRGLGGERPRVPVSPERLEAAARAKLGAPDFAYLAGGAGTERTMRANLAAFERVADEARRALEEAVAVSAPQPEVRARAAVAAFVALVLDAPHKGRLLLLEPFADPALGAHSHRLMPVFTDLVGGQLAGTGDGIDRRMAAHALVGGLASLFAGWLHGTLDVPRERLEAHCVQLVLAATSPREQ